jgi:hypothetical protein
VVQYTGQHDRRSSELPTYRANPGYRQGSLKKVSGTEFAIPMRFTCTICGADHDLEEISFGSDAPLQWSLLSDDERSRSLLGDEQCEIESDEGRSFYIRACLEIPIRATDRAFTWGVWCSLSETSYQEIAEHWEDPARPSLGPHFGWLCTAIPGYPDTAFLKTMVHQREVGTRPRVVLGPTDHPLAIDQRDGIEEARLRDILIGLLHDE